MRSVCQYVDERVKSGEKTSAQQFALHLLMSTFIKVDAVLIFKAVCIWV